MLLPRMSTHVPYEHVDVVDDRLNSLFEVFVSNTIKYVDVDDVTITFGMSGAWWRRTGHGEPVRVAQPAPTRRLRAQVEPFVADWISRIRRHVHRQ